MEHYRPHRSPTSRVIVNGSLSPTDSPVVSRTRSRQRPECSSSGNQHVKDNTKILGGSWRSPNQSNYLPVSPPHPSSVHNFGISVAPSTSDSNIHNSLQVPQGLHRQSLNGLPYSNHVFGSKSVFGSTITQHKIASHRNADNEEAMDIDGQEEIETGGHISTVPLSSTVNHSTVSQTGAMRVQNSASTSGATGATELESPLKKNDNQHNRSWKELNIKSKVNNRKSVDENKPSYSDASSSKAIKGAVKKRAIYIVMHVSKVTIGELHAKASAPVKIYADKVFVEAELEDHSVLSLKIPCKEFSHCAVSFELPKPMIVFTLTKAAIKSILDLNKNKGRFLDPDQCEGDHKNRLVLQLNSTSLTGEVKQDLIELFQKRLSDHLKWKEISSSEMNTFLHQEENATGHSKANEAQTEPRDNDLTNIPSIQPSSPPVTISARKILTPRKSRVVQKGLFQESTSSTPESSFSQSKGDTSIPASSVTQSSSKVATEVTCVEQENKIVTRSRRRKADAMANEPPSSPKTATNDSRDPVVKVLSGAERESKRDTDGDKNTNNKTVDQAKERDSTSMTPGAERDILHHHSRIESHISLLGVQSEKQRHTLEHHQKLLTLEREERNRSIEKIQELQSTNREKQEYLRIQNETIELLNIEIENQNISIRQLQQKLAQEREMSARMRKVQTDLTQLRRELNEEKVLREIRDKQLLDKENELVELRRVSTEERNLRQGLNEELQRVQNACLQHIDELENQRLFRQTQDRELQGKQDRLQDNERRYQEERTARINLEDEMRRLRIENDEMRRSRDVLQNDLLEIREQARQDRESFTQERQNLEQRIQDSERSVVDCERRLRELQAALNSSQSMVEEHRRLEPRDWIIRRDEVTITETVLGTGAWGSVKVGIFRGCKVAVKQIHELILSPHNRRLFEREMSIASRCRHPCLLQFIGATNDDGIPLFLTEILDTDLRAILSRRSLHQEEIIVVALDVARSLNYLHLSKPFPIIHRDISSSNVLLWKRDTCWRAKLSDYGAANFMRQYMTVNPGAGIYAAPEASTSQQSPKVDIYSFGLLLCEMCIRELPVPQQTRDQISLVTNGVLRELIMRCVHNDPEARPAVAEVITLLEQQEENLLERGLVTVNGRSATL